MTAPMRQFMERRKQAAPKAESVKPASPTGKQKPPVIGTEPIVASCGHTVEFELFADKADKFDARRAKITGKACPACRQEAERKRQAASPPKPKKAWIGHHDVPERLPDGAVFHVAYNAAQQRWEGTLTVSGMEFRGIHSAVFKLLRHLDWLYRAKKKQIDAEESALQAAAGV